MTDQDTLRRFIFEQAGVRGEWLKLTDSWQAVSDNHAYPPVVKEQLGHAVAAATLLAATIKFNGALVLQAQGEGSLKAIVAQCTHDRCIRGLARYREPVVAGGLSQLYGSGRLVLTIETERKKPYQGIVSLDGENLAQALENYYQQSEQLPTRLWLFANETTVSGLFLQALPAASGFGSDWERIVMLADTIRAEELLDLSCEAVLHRLFHEETLRLFKAEPIQFKCSCSNGKIERTLKSLGRASLEEILEERDAITVDCEFCNQQYHFDRVDIELLLVPEIDLGTSKISH
ncbi:MAG TPA: Hsp33 family molecular chaperone HslO [Methylococcaceae bacterium]|jgi:molecular chaperone Hsp33|nr:Hsp33 family molecular chaperone HslO [Methylococcaceae bacterium]HIA46211.1 Hsp33 family molecular chaperone HslO [Methylococcaceae bacterium]HIN68050.1 Hsp33 family molecular chaperone HslO [Methylococcales bacterium]HIO12368.1 Hsp33 family molecular chaperone HslO [Methylococcales bacterium]HIO45425.1 Hsp33 family molecular chaperone HslO [Methylococcales bacterium]